MDKKIIYDLSTSALDVPLHISVLCFLTGCAGICDYCYNTNLWDTKQENKFSLEDLKNLILKQNRKYRLLTAISITGAEPLRKVNVVKKILRFINTNFPYFYKNLDTSLTQGNLTLDTLDLLDRISISVKDVWDHHKYYDQVLSNLELISKSSKDVEVRLVLTKFNYNKLYDLVKSLKSTLKKMNISRVKITCAITTQDNKNKFTPLSVSEFEKVYKDFENLFHELLGDINVRKVM